ncbi:putative alpha/Beta hydrolase [Helianthus annuus]|nr:putative alpha/Beta hydrolase [Helianthus annuus]
MKPHRQFAYRTAALFFIGLLAWAYQNTLPPPPKLCGSPGGPPVTGPRVTLRDGRHLAYKEYGVSRDVADYKIVFVHGFGSCRYDESVFHPVIN